MQSPNYERELLNSRFLVDCTFTCELRNTSGKTRIRDVFSVRE